MDFTICIWPRQDEGYLMEMADMELLHHFIKGTLNVQVDDNVIDVGVVDASVVGVDVKHGFRGGLRDCMLLVSFGNHVIVRLWEVED
ncbi:hypothetical protein DEO72_LG7g1456 [Vigna unguiculata]|uniref:Uncharacterized protein n=1 Tax=Vigna unguiculata TaxID=3917 RepID=A0A4D6MJ07_VIGUN|nr:hypothetical protein DEO72_LG7g1456 [Vigna unguiculata]